MSEETQDCIFEPFFTLREDAAHSGLGLSIAQRIISDCKGFMDVRSGLGRGTEITFGLPCLETDPFAYLDEVTDDLTISTQKTILVVENDEAVRCVIREILEQSGYQVIAASDGEAAISLASIHNGPISLLVADVCMPGISGPDLVCKFAPLRPESQLLLVSELSSEEIDTCSELPSGIAVLKKPFATTDLLHRIRSLLG